MPGRAGEEPGGGTQLITSQVGGRHMCGGGEWVGCS